MCMVSCTQANGSENNYFHTPRLPVSLFPFTILAEGTVRLKIINKTFMLVAYYSCLERLQVSSINCSQSLTDILSCDGIDYFYFYCEIWMASFKGVKVGQRRIFHGLRTSPNYCDCPARDVFVPSLGPCGDVHAHADTLANIQPTKNLIHFQSHQVNSPPAPRASLNSACPRGKQYHCTTEQS